MTSPLTVYEMFAVLTLTPLLFSFRRAGLTPWPALAVFLPYLGFAIAISALAFPRWPSLPPKIVKAKRR